MELYDETVSLINKFRYKLWLNYLTESINKKGIYLTNTEFKNCLNLTLAIWDDNFIDNYFNNNMNRNKIRKILKTSFKLIQSLLT